MDVPDADQDLAPALAAKANAGVPRRPATGALCASGGVLRADAHVTRCVPCRVFGGFGVVDPRRLPLHEALHATADVLNRGEADVGTVAVLHAIAVLDVERRHRAAGGGDR